MAFYARTGLVIMDAHGAPPLLHFRLSDGRPVALRPVVPGDRTRLAAGFEALSEASRRLRFLGPLPHLKPEQLAYLTEIDQVDHVAWGALDPTQPDHPGLGVGRFIRLPEHPTLAEFSLTVLDAAQSQGLGSLLLAALYAVAPTVDIRVLRGVIARDNRRMTTWLSRLGARLLADEGSAFIYDLPVHADVEQLPAAAEAFKEQVRLIRAHRAGQSQNDV